MAKKPHQKKDSALQITQQDTEQTNKSLSKIANNKIEESLKEFSKLSEKERDKFPGSKEFFEQFWEYFKQQHPNLLDEIDSQEKLTIYVQNLEEKGFSIENLMKNSKELHKDFKETNNEKESIVESLKQFQQHCNNPENKMPANIFNDFANDINLKTTPNISIDKKTKISKIGNLFSVWTNYLENNGIKLKDHQKSEAEKILCPRYVPTERLLISATIKKIKKNLPDTLITDFEAAFPLPIDIHSSFENLKDLKQQRTLFLDGHKNVIDENLAKKLDKIIITNGDVYKELQYEGEKIERTKGFGEQTENFRRMFNSLATRQIFDDTKEAGSYIEHHLELLGKEFKEFPPYFNELFNIYPYKHKDVIENQPEFKTIYQQQESLLQEKEALLNKEKPESEKNKSLEQRREENYQEVLKAKEDLNAIKRKAYAAYINQKNPELGTMVSALVENKFDMAKLSKSDQQKIVNILVTKKLGDSIKNQIPQTLKLDPKEYKEFVENLFDLNQQDIVIPTQYGNIPLHFLEKSFFGGPTKEAMEINNSGTIITEKHNLPLNFKVEITEQNKEFFEDNIIFDDLFKSFNSKKGPVRLNDSYKVSIKRKDGTSVEGYLSQQIPTKELEEEIESGAIRNGWFLYSQPITRPEDADERKIITREGTPGGTPVAIPETKENEYDIDIVSKEINLNGEAIGALLFSHTLGQYNVKNDLTKDQEKKLAQKFGKLDKNTVYKDVDVLDKIIDQDKRQEEKPREKTREKEYEEFLEERKNLRGYQEKGKSEEKTYGFKKGAKLLIQGPESGFEPIGSFQYINAEISNIDKELGVFKVKFTGSEQSLGKYEGTEKQFSLAKKGLQKFKDVFEENKIFKLPNENICNDIKSVISTFEDNKIDNVEPGASFQGTSRNGNNFVIDMGKEEGKEVTHFGVIETLPGESQNEESKTGYMYKIEHEPLKKRFKVIANDKEKTTIHLDYPNFVLFVASKKLQPKTEESSKGIDIPEKEGPTIDKPKKRKGYSIASVLGLVKNFGKKIGDSLKKYEEEQIEELTEDMFFHGKLFHKLAGIMPTKKLQESFENVGDEYLIERDNKVWKKIEKYQKFYESDPDFGGDYLWTQRIQPYLEGKKPFKDHHQAAAMLLATTKKGKGPYSRNTDRAGKGNRVRILFGEGHQKRYLLMKEKLQRELDQGYKVHGQIWADNLQNEILKLEMKYITHCIDGRQLRVGGSNDDTPQLEGMYSKKFASTLEEETNKFFSESVSGSSKEKGYSFELARFEYFRLLADRPQQAIPCLKQIAAKAVTPNQWRVFESAVLTGMLSGAFYNITQEDKSFIQKICRAIGFLPGMWIRDPNHHHKVEHFIKIATGEDIVGYEKKDDKIIPYKSDKFGFGKGKDLDQFKKVAGYDNGLNLRLTGSKKEGAPSRLKQIAEFAAMKGQNFEGKSLIELINDPRTPIETIYLLKEIEKRSLEKDEEVDPDIKMNGYGLEQNILAKNQSLIDEITDFQEGKFKGKNKDEIQGIQTARSRIAKDIPRKEIKDKNQVIYLLKKFMNWFEGRGFNTEEKKFLVRTLLTAKEEINKGHGQSADEMLWYVTVGNIVKNSGNGQAPDELINGLEAFKDFFKNNLNTILESDVIEQSLGSMYLEAKNKGAFEVGPWEEYVDLTKNKFFIGRSKEENKIRNEKQKKYKNPEIINEKIYEIAKQVNQRNHIENKFDRYFNLDATKTISEKLHETLEKKNIRFKNPETAGKIRHILSEKDNSENLSDDDLAAAAQMEEDQYYS
ncbi:hypothetical protein P148_SR1C00001G0958 [candidate division SR1 bacterium RAAC1_SR1_1]|nr:hypothetical protein P148_SR1C00001G0958 [candidate division SR1 bacterium RAAC1_SR1_1]